MTEPKWLRLEAVLAFHQESLRQHGGLHGIRDLGMLESALDRPKNKFYYEEASLESLAAAYAFGIALNHPFADGNKRTAFIAMAVFLEINGLTLTASEVDAYTTIMNLAAGELTEPELAEWTAANSASKA
jgi:death on curing protein